jgi:DNA-directed RNA polymerase specialized sigma24 family protein
MPIEDPGSVSECLVALGREDRLAFDLAVKALWDRYFAELVRQASSRLRGAPRSLNNGEDVALSAFYSFVERAALGAFPRLHDRHDLWRLLITITARKAALQYRRSHPAGASAPLSEAIASPEQPPDLIAMVEDELRALRDALNSDCRTVADRKLEGWTNQEIAQALGWSTRKVERKISIIRDTWLTLRSIECSVESEL